MDVSTDVLWNVMLRMDPYTLQNACTVNTLSSEICKKESFWKQKIENDFKRRPLKKLGDLSWKETWVALNGEMTFNYSISSYEIGEAATDENHSDFTPVELNGIKKFITDITKDFIEFDSLEHGLELFKYFEFEIKDGIFSISLFSSVIFDVEDSIGVYSNIFSYYINSSKYQVGERTVFDDSDNTEYRVLLILQLFRL